MKKFISICIVILTQFFVAHGVFAQEPMISFQATESLSKVVKNDFESTRLNFSFAGLNYVDIETKEGVFTELIMPGGYSTGELGTPRLPAARELIEIPVGAEVSVEVKSYDIEEYKLSEFGIEHKLMPVQPSIRKDQDVNEIPFKHSVDYYSRKSFIEPELASVEVLGVLRGMRLGRLEVAPVHYNPEEGIIKVYNNVELEITYSGADKKLTSYTKASAYSPYFDVVYNQVINPFGNKDIFDDYPDLTKYPVKMVIVSDREFEGALEPFIDWKTKQGYKLITEYTDNIGSSAADVKNFIHSHYAAGTPEDPAPTFVVIVGDASKIPASATGSQSGAVTDLYYASVDGNYFPDMYLGRLSARNVQELENQINKILYYQKYEFNDPSYLNDATLIAGSDSYWNPRIGEPTIKYATANYFNLANGFNTVWGFGVDDDPNNPDNNSGYTGYTDETRTSVSIINYTAHCSSTSWSTSPYLYASDVHNMTNTGKYPLAVGNCCKSALFSHSESIGEAWVRAEDKGAVAYIGSAPNSYWFEDFYWAVGAFPISGNNDGYVPTTEETTLGVYDVSFNSDYYAVGAKKFVGNLAVTEAHLQGYESHSNVQYYWEAYQTLGDPSTVIYLTEGRDNVVSYPSTIEIGIDHYTLEAFPGSYAAVSMDGVLLGAALVGESGVVDVPVDVIEEPGEVDLVVTKPQHIPYITNIMAVADGPYASFTADPLEIALGESVTFTDTSDPDGGEFSTWEWDFGEGAQPETATGEGPHQVVYNTPGTKTVSLLVDGQYERTRHDYINVLDVYTLIININGEGSVEVEGSTYTEPVELTENSNVKLEAFPDELRHFSAWTGDLAGTDNPVDLMMDDNKTITANFSNAVSATYTEGDIPSDIDFTGLPGESGCPATLIVPLPNGAVITGVDVEYEMTALPDTPDDIEAWMSEQVSWLRCVSPGGTDETTVSTGTGDSPGTYSYKRTGLDIANEVTGGGDVTFELHAGRTWGGSGCNEDFNIVDNNTWKVTVYYNVEDNNIVKVNDLSAIFGDTITVKVDVENEDEFIAFQMDFDLPEGFEYVDDSFRLSERSDDHSGSSDVLEDNVLRVIAFSMSNNSFKGNSGRLFSFDLNTPGEEGSWKIVAENVTLSNVDSQNIYSGSLPGTIKLFETMDFMVNIEIMPEGSGKVEMTPDQSFYNPGDLIGLNAKAAEGYIFREWVEENDVISSQQEFTYTMPADDVDLKAVFDLDNIAGNLSETGLRIFPNPANNEVKITYNEPIEKVMIADVNGRVLYVSETIKNSRHKIDVSQLDTGVYFVIVIAENNVVRSKILVY